jgi:competence protein ComGC
MATALTECCVIIIIVIIIIIIIIIIINYIKNLVVTRDKGEDG